jgi:hypothetical protein
MTDLTADQLDALQFVVNRVGAYQDGAPEGTVEKELRKGLDEADLSLEESQVTALAEAIESADGTVDASSVLS